MRTIIVSAAVALIFALVATPLAIRVFNRRGYGQPISAEIPPTDAINRGTATMGGTVLVLASVVGYVVGHVLTSSPLEPNGLLVLGLMTGFGLVGFLDDYINIYRQTRVGPRSRTGLAHRLDGIETGATILVLATYVLTLNWRLSNDCVVLLTQNCHVVRDPLDLMVVAAAVLGACFGFLWWNASAARILMGATGTLALGGVLAGLALTTHTQLLLVMLSGLLVIITLSAIRKWADR